MTSVLRHHRYGRTLGTGVLTVALLSGGTTGAFAQTSTPTPTPTPTSTGSPTPTSTGSPTASPTMTRSGMATMRPSRTPTSTPTRTRTGTPTMRPPRTAPAMGMITVSANHKAVKVGSTVVFTGRVRAVKSGSTVVLQHLKNGKWATLKYTGVVNKNGTYTIKRTFSDKGTHHVRVATKSGAIHSSPVTVKVS